MTSPSSRAARLARPALLAGLLALSLAMAACGGGGGTTATTSAGADASGGAGASGGTIGFSIPQGSDPSLQLASDGLKAEAGKHGLKVETVDANLDPGKQIADVNTLIQQKVKAIVVWPLDDKAIQPAVKQANAAKIPVIAIYALSGGRYYTDVILDGHRVGQLGAKYMAGALGEGAQVAAVFGPPQVTQFREIAEGFTAEAKASGLDLVESQVDRKISPEGAVTFARGFKQRHPSLKGLFVSYETGALGVSPVIGDDFTPALVGYGATDAALKGVAGGELSATIYQSYVLLGRIIGWAAAKAVAGEKVPPKLYLGASTLTKDDVSSFPDTAAQLTEPYDFKPVKQNGKLYMPLFK